MLRAALALALWAAAGPSLAGSASIPFPEFADFEFGAAAGKARKLIGQAQDQKNIDLPLLHYQRRPVHHEESVDAKGIMRLEFWTDPPAGEEPFKRVFRVYWQRWSPGERRPFILVFPISGDGDWRICKMFCERFTAEGLNCGYFEKNLDGANRGSFDRIYEMPQFPPKSVDAARRGLDVLEDLGVIMPGEKIGVIGVSLGSFEASLTALTDSRVGAAVLVAGGGGVASILSRTNGAGVGGYARAREAFMKEHGLNTAQLIERMEGPGRRSDPLAYAQAIPPGERLAPEKFLIMYAKGDTAVPNDSSEQLYSALSDGNRHPYKEIISHFWLKNDYMHVSLVLDLNYLEERSVEHFYRTLGPQLERPDIHNPFSSGFDPRFR
jgi:pimeloyl-ACP methyl ester carboxylesterase